ncbi:zf-DHHC-domain-containing protein [Rhizodiscina lignyota]|uniref:Palmitoyltransferase n=1 Tax=Rhizodiscina lignyota TaxID=1504668 RepID=A0A9P4MEM1_9PEZI|nr:zf-DHHC-domain-containing protein [Rhizodiscina lignyota]
MRAANIGTAIAVPLALLAVIGYVTFVNVDVICVHYLLDPSSHYDAILKLPTRTGAALAILIIHFILLLLMLIPYARLLLSMVSNSNYIPRGSEELVDRATILSGAANLPKGAEKFYKRDIFVCDYQGLPNYCTECRCYKPDRAHHSSDVGRCVIRMDHFCPWVGGMVAELNHKWFIQFLVYASFFSVFILATMAYMLHDQLRRVGSLNAHTIVATAFGGMFSLFSVGMAGNTIYLAMQNLTTIETLDQKARSYYFAVLINGRQREAIDSPQSAPIHTITYTRDGQKVSISPNASPGGDSRTYAVLQTRAGDRPWDLGSSNNWKQIMGRSWLDWLLPIQRSPMCRHDRSGPEYPFGAAVDRMVEDSGIGMDSLVHTSHNV